jgi:hypothetical protein
MRGMATVTFILDAVTALAEGGPDFLRDGKIFPLNLHAVEPDGVTSFPEFRQLLGMAFPAFFWKDHGLLVGGCLMVDVAGDAMDPVLGVL